MDDGVSTDDVVAAMETMLDAEIHGQAEGTTIVIHDAFDFQAAET